MMPIGGSFGLLLILAVYVLIAHTLVFLPVDGEAQFKDRLLSVVMLLGYEVALGFSVAALVLVSGSLDVAGVISDQSSFVWKWNLFRQPGAFVVVFSSLLMIERFFSGSGRLVRITFQIANSIFIAALFIGGSQIPFMTPSWIFVRVEDWAAPTVVLSAQIAILVTKTVLAYLSFSEAKKLLIGISPERFTEIAWKFLIPISIVNLFITASVILK